MVFLVKKQKYNIIHFVLSPFFQPDPSLTKPTFQPTFRPKALHRWRACSVQSHRAHSASQLTKRNIKKKRKWQEEKAKQKTTKRTTAKKRYTFLVMFFGCVVSFFLSCFACQNTPTSKLGSRFVLVRKFVKVIFTLILLWDSWPAMVASFFGVVPHSM